MKADPNPPRLAITANQRIALTSVVLLALDQITKAIVLQSLGRLDERVIVEGFFKFVHWTNTGAAWSMFRDRNELLAVISLFALLGLFLGRRFFEIGSPLGQVALGLTFGGIAGNIIDRLHAGHVIDFLRFYIVRRDGSEIGFPAFNVADSGICIGVGLLFLISWNKERAKSLATP